MERIIDDENLNHNSELHTHSDKHNHEDELFVAILNKQNRIQLKLNWWNLLDARTDSRIRLN
jgi:hypothetical protein